MRLGGLFTGGLIRLVVLGDLVRDIPIHEDLQRLNVEAGNLSAVFPEACHEVVQIGPLEIRTGLRQTYVRCLEGQPVPQ